MTLIIIDILFSTMLIACIIFVILGTIWAVLKILYEIKKIVEGF